MDMSNQVALQNTNVPSGEATTIAFSKLYRDPLNVRKKAARNVEALAALIVSQGGVLQNLIVRAERNARKRRTGRFGVIAGGRRLAALQLLRSQDLITNDFPVPVLIVSDEAALAASLAENSAREDLHGADLFEAFKAMAEQGRSESQIADAWGVTKLTVQRRLKLANVSPALIELYRNDEITGEQMAALALVEDHALQERVWHGSPLYDRDPESLRAKLTERELPADDVLASFVGLDRYTQAGGAVRRDLFADDDSGTFLCDAGLVERLASDLIAEHAEAVRAEGWAWVEGRVRFPWNERHQFDRCRTVQREPSDEQSAQLDAWSTRMDELDQQHDELADDADEQALLEEMEAIEQQRDAVLDSLQVADPVDAAIAGAVVYVERNGSVAVLRGVVRPEDRASRTAAGPEGVGEGMATSGASKPARAEFTEGLLKQLTAHRTAALRESLASSPKVALRILAFQLACEVLESHRYHFERDTPVQIRLTDSALGSYDNAMEETRAVVDMTTRAQQWAERLPGTTEALLAWALQADDYDIGELLAFCVASSLLAVDAKPGKRPVTDAIARAVDLDMADWWQATGASYLGAVPKAKVIEAVTEACGEAAAAPLRAMKKDEAVAAAERALDGKRWLPKPLRTSEA